MPNGSSPSSRRRGDVLGWTGMSQGETGPEHQERVRQSMLGRNSFGQAWEAGELPLGAVPVKQVSREELAELYGELPPQQHVSDDDSQRDQHQTPRRHPLGEDPGNRER